MRKISDIRELYGNVYELLIEIICPNCEHILISTMSQAEMILIFGCQNCTNIDQSMLTEMNLSTIEIIPEEAITECMHD